jgi:CheY-like chemotaxis protein
MIARAPADARRRHPTIGGEAAHGQPRLDGANVLLVDDERDSNEVVAALLESCGATVRLAGSVAHARTVLAGWSPDLVVTDIGMPGEDGFALLATLRDTGAAVPAVALTAYASRDDRIRLLAAGFQAHLAKPVDPVELVTVVANLARSRPA